MVFDSALLFRFLMVYELVSVKLYGLGSDSVSAKLYVLAFETAFAMEFDLQYESVFAILCE